MRTSPALISVSNLSLHSLQYVDGTSCYKQMLVANSYVCLHTSRKQVGISGGDYTDRSVAVALSPVYLFSQIQCAQLGKIITQVTKNNGLTVKKRSLQIF